MRSRLLTTEHIVIHLRPAVHYHAPFVLDDQLIGIIVRPGGHIATVLSYGLPVAGVIVGIGKLLDDRGTGLLVGDAGGLPGIIVRLYTAHLSFMPQFVESQLIMISDDSRDSGHPSSPLWPLLEEDSGQWGQ